MADNSTMGGNTDSIRDKDRSGVKTQIVGLDVAIGTGTESLLSAANPMPVTLAASATNTSASSGALTGSGVSVSATVSTSGNATVVILGGTYTNLPIAFEATADGSNWFAVDATRTDGSGIDLAPTLPSTATRAWNVIAPGYSQIRVRQTAAATAQTGNPTVAFAQGPFIYDPSPVVAPIDGQKLTYSATLNSTNVAAAVTASVPVWELVNAGTKLIRVTRIAWELTLATAGSAPLMVLQKRTAASTVGTAVTQTPISHDTLSATTAVTSKYYTAIPTVAGSSLGNIRSHRVFGIATTMTAQPQLIEWTFGNRPGQGIILRANESLNIQMQAAAGTAPTLTGSAEWTEE